MTGERKFTVTIFGKSVWGALKNGKVTISASYGSLVSATETKVSSGSTIFTVPDWAKPSGALTSNTIDCGTSDSAVNLSVTYSGNKIVSAGPNSWTITRLRGVNISYPCSGTVTNAATGREFVTLAQLKQLI